MEVMVCTRCFHYSTDVPQRPNNWTESGLATVLREGDKYYVVPHLPSCRELAQAIRRNTTERSQS